MHGSHLPFIFSIQKMNARLRLERPAKFDINQLDGAVRQSPLNSLLYYFIKRCITFYPVKLQYIQQIIKIMREKTELITGPHQLISEHEKEKRCVRTKQPPPRYY